MPILPRPIVKDDKSQHERVSRCADDRGRRDEELRASKSSSARQITSETSGTPEILSQDSDKSDISGVSDLFSTVQRGFVAALIFEKCMLGGLFPAIVLYPLLAHRGVPVFCAGPARAGWRAKDGHVLRGSRKSRGSQEGTCCPELIISRPLQPCHPLAGIFNLCHIPNKISLYPLMS